MPGLFDTRGGLTMFDRCELCNERLREHEEGLCHTCERDAIADAGAGEDDA